MASLLIRSIRYLVTCDDKDHDRNCKNICEIIIKAV